MWVSRYECSVSGVESLWSVTHYSSWSKEHDQYDQYHEKNGDCDCRDEKYFHLSVWIGHVLKTYIKICVPYGHVLLKWYDMVSDHFNPFDPLTYFSVWNLVLCVVFLCVCGGKRKKHSFLQEIIVQCTRVSCIVSSVGGFYLAWIRPCHVYIWYINLYIDGIIMKCVDLLAHHVPLFLFWKREGFKGGTLYGSIYGWIPTILYMAIQRSNILFFYSVTWYDILIIGGVSLSVSLYTTFTRYV